MRRRHLIPDGEEALHALTGLCRCLPRLDLEPADECQTGNCVDWTWCHQRLGGTGVEGDPDNQR